MPRPTYVGGTSGGGTGASYNVSLSGTLTGGSNSSPSQGDLIVVCAAHGATASSAPTCSGNTSGAYQPVHAALYSNDTWDTNMRTFYQFAGVTPDTTLTIGRTNNTTFGGATVVHVWRGVDPTTPIDVTANTNSANNQSASRPNPPSHTPSTADAVVIACGAGMQTTAGAAFTIPSGMANGVSQHFDGSTSDIGTFISSFDWVSGAYDPAAVTGGTTNASSSNASATFSLRPAPAPNYDFTLQGGSYSLTGASATLLRSKTIVASGGSYSLAGQSADITYTPFGVNYDFVLQGGSYTLAGQSASLSRNRSLTAQGGSYAQAGQQVTLLRSKRIVANGGSYTLAGQSASISRNRSLTSQGGSYALAGQTASLLRSKLVTAQGGAYTYAGQSAGLFRSRLITAAGGTYNYTGQSVGMDVGPAVPPTAHQAPNPMMCSVGRMMNR
jgi:hypothetical protein